MFNAILLHCYIPVLTAAVCALYVTWKAKGGSILFRTKKTDQPSTVIMKGLAEFGWIYGSIIVAMIIGAIASVWFVIALVATLISGS